MRVSEGVASGGRTSCDQRQPPTLRSLHLIFNCSITLGQGGHPRLGGGVLGKVFLPKVLIPRRSAFSATKLCKARHVQLGWASHFAFGGQGGINCGGAIFNYGEAFSTGAKGGDHLQLRDGGPQSSSTRRGALKRRFAGRADLGKISTFSEKPLQNKASS